MDGTCAGSWYLPLAQGTRLNIQTVTPTWNARTAWFCYMHLFGSLGKGTWFFGMHTLFVKNANEKPVILTTILDFQGTRNHDESINPESTPYAYPPPKSRQSNFFQAGIYFPSHWAKGWSSRLSILWSFGPMHREIDPGGVIHHSLQSQIIKYFLEFKQFTPRKSNINTKNCYV